MAPPPPSTNFQQRQPITTTLRDICERYPQNTCLRELLQNADDAGATELEYVVDTNAYTNRPLLHPKLDEYHGPALLARNNSIFTETDFSSLSSVGDSAKRKDPASTGKFGQGFNTVYHWTDGPWIYSGKSLLILDPHERWSKGTGNAGGPTWDVVLNQDSVEIQNALKTFAVFNTDYTKESKETIIRIPLRTADQANTSDIIKEIVTVDKIKEAVDIFIQELEDGGLLFLKHIRKVIIRVDSSEIFRIEASEQAIGEKLADNQISVDFKCLYASNTSTQDVCRLFDKKIVTSRSETQETRRYIIQHTMMSSSGDKSMDKWAAGRKLYPWVAVAAPLNNNFPDNAIHGSLFSTLKLPMPANQPVHLHALFAITQNRASFISKDEPSAEKWNRFIFSKCLSRAWARMLVHPNSVSWQVEGFDLWPRADSSKSEFSAILGDCVIDKMIQEELEPAIKMLDKASESKKRNFLSHCAKLIREQFYSDPELLVLAALVWKMPVFSRISCRPPFRQLSITRCNLNKDVYSFEAPQNLPFLPEIAGLVFYDLSDPAERFVVDKLSLLKKVSVENLLAQHLLPWMEQITELDLSRVKETLADWIFEQSKTSSDSWKANVLSRPIVPLPKRNIHRTFGRLDQLVDPTSAFAMLYFEDEGVFPCPEFFTRHKEIFSACGISDGAASNTPLQRAKYFAECGADSPTLMEKVSCLFKMPVHASFSSSQCSADEIRGLKFVPGISSEGIQTKFAPRLCRGADQSHLIDRVWGTTAFSVGQEWKKLLGWDQDVPGEVIFEQLDSCIAQRQFEKVDKLLHYVKRQDFEILRSKPCILGSHRQFMHPGKVFYPGTILESYSLFPHIDKVDQDFAKKHSKLLAAFGIRSDPSPQDLQYVQSALVSSGDGRLTNTDLRIAIGTLEVADRLSYNSIHLKIPDTDSKMRRRLDMVWGDRIITGDADDVAYAHASMSKDLLRRLKVEKSQERATRLNLDLEDEDEDEYTPREKLSTIICDTLGRYPIDSTFSEFLANADDAGATKIIWTLDECPNGPYESDTLLTEELKEFQGPALVVFNDGVFKEKDFAGFKEIGQGGKADDATTTGMFGRGALSMYHFTDVPMMISGDQFLILDPQQERLPRNSTNNKRKLGVKISLKKARHVAPNQLKPFDGLHGYHKDLDHYPGTIFRFPFRTMGRKSDLRDVAQNVSPAMTRTLLDDYLETARISLLFLYSIDTIAFYVRGVKRPSWSVSAKRSGSDLVFRSIVVTTQKEELLMTDTWRVGMIDIEKLRAGVVKSGKGSSKNTECGIAACLRPAEKQMYSQGTKVSPCQAALLPKGVQQSIFCRLPTSASTHLPVSIHASFAITGDRKTIVCEGEDDTSKWNRTLLEDCVAAFYLDFLQDLTRRIGEEAFRFWPSSPKPEFQSSLSGYVAKAFWDNVMKRESCELYPIAAAQTSLDDNDSSTIYLRRNKDRPTRRLHAATTATNARFDFFADTASRRLRPLFDRIGLDLVRPPRRIWQNLKGAASASRLHELDSAFLCQTFKLEHNCIHLQGFLANCQTENKKSESIAILLELLVPQIIDGDSRSLDMLDNCTVLPRPRLDAPLGLLKMNGKETERQTFFATLEEQRLFSFAADGYMVNTELFASKKHNLEDITEPSKRHRDPIAEIMQAQSNIRKLKTKDVGFILKSRNSPIISTEISSKRDEWMVQFWTYLNVAFGAIEAPQNLKIGSTLSAVNELLTSWGIMDLAIYSILKGPKLGYMTPLEFADQPCIVDPELTAQKSFCAQICGLIRVNRNHLPLPLLETENDLGKQASFLRFLKALVRIERSRGVLIKDQLSAKMTPPFASMLRKLVLGFLTHYSKESVPEISVLQALPVWPRLQRAAHMDLSEYISADEARFCMHSGMFASWIKDLTQFVDPKLVEAQMLSFQKLGAQILSSAEFWDYIKRDLPISLSDSKKQYLLLISQIASDAIKATGKIAPNGVGMLCETNSLYDYEVDMFREAFNQEQPTRFLHPEFRKTSLRTFWLSAGLRTRSANVTLSSEDFLACILAVDRQWQSIGWNPLFDQAATTVSAHLLFDKPEFLSWSANTWEKISVGRIFLVKSDLSDQPLFRQNRMQQLANENAYCALKDVGPASNIRTLWSQVKFLQNPPASDVLQHFPLSTFLRIPMVYQHLQFLVSICWDVSQRDIPEYLKDIQACYEYLQENTNVTRTISGIRDTELWFNVDTTQTDIILKESLLGSLFSARHLCLNSPADFKSIRVARKFLVPYEKLLRALGCQSVVQPNSSVSSTADTQFPMAKSMLAIRDFRDQSQLTDVILEVDGQEKSAHKLLLAAVSSKWRSQFTRDKWKQEAIVNISDISFGTLSQMVDFAYSGLFPEPQLKDSNGNREVADILDGLLALLDGTNKYLMDGLHEKVEDFLLSPAHSQIYVRVDNVEEVMVEARHARAFRLAKHCEIFIAANAEFVRAFKDEEVLDEAT